MATNIRSELSPKNKYWLDRHRYYELKHFCMQYPLWLRAYNELDGISTTNTESIFIKSLNASNPVMTCAEARLYYSDRMSLIESAAFETDKALARYILEAVVYGYSYDCIKARLNIPCGKDKYYELYRKFFWLLSHHRG